MLNTIDSFNLFLDLKSAIRYTHTRDIPGSLYVEGARQTAGASVGRVPFPPCFG